MVPNGASYANFPSFANNGTKTPPGGSTESAKYALGMVPADTFPAEWANYLFHGATEGITRLNTDAGSMKREINTVLACKNITPDATACDQLYCALLKIRDDAVALAYPVGTVYMNAKCATLPDSIQAIGTWCAIDGRFLRACASCLGCTGGADNVTLAVCNLPSHCHTTPNHCHSMTHCHGVTAAGSISGGSYSFSGTTANTCNGGVDHTHSGNTLDAAGKFGGYRTQNTNAYGTGPFSTNTGGDKSSPANYASGSYATEICFSLSGKWTGSTSGASAYSHCHSYKPSGTISVSSNPTFSGSLTNTASTYCASSSDKTHALPKTGNAAPTTCNTGSGCSFSILPSYKDVAMWYRDA